MASAGAANVTDNPTYGSSSETERLIHPEVVVVGSLDSRSTSRRRSTPVILSVTVNTEDEDNKVVEVDGVNDPGFSIQNADRVSVDSGGDPDDPHGGKRTGTRAHCHVDPRDTGVDKKARFKLVLASLLCMVFMICECVGGVLAHSLAVVSDAAHLLTDFASFMISLMALYLASRPATKRLSFGWHRAEILGALVSILMLWVITGVLAYSAVLRVQSGDYEIDATIMLITSATGVFFNVVLGCTLHQHGHGHGHSHSHGHSHNNAATTPTTTSTTTKQQHPPPSPPPSPTHRYHSDENPDHSPLLERNSTTTSSYRSSRGYGSLASSNTTTPQHHQQHQHQYQYQEQYRDLEDGGGEVEVEKRKETLSLSAAAAAKKKKKESNINVKAAFIHVVGDFCQSVGVLIAAFIIYFKPEWKIADPICTFLFSLLVLITTITIMRDILVVLMEGTPRNINFEEVRDSLLGMEGVKDLHDLRVWSLTMDKTAMSVHLAVEPGIDPMLVVQETSRLIQHKYNITQTTIQVEEFSQDMMDCTRCQNLKD